MKFLVFCESENVAASISYDTEDSILTREMYDFLYQHCTKDKEKELFDIIFFKQSKLVDYAAKHSISRQAANRQALMLRKKFYVILNRNKLGV